jgi:beta-carotene 15,15'-dioxygenase
MVIRNWAYKILETPTAMTVLIGVVLVFWQQLGGGLPFSAQATFFILFLLLTGIPHGAIDHLVEEETAKKTQKTFNLVFFLIKYLLTMAFYGVLWYFLPSLSLLFFLLISAWHFGETDIEKAADTIAWNSTRFIFGALLLAWILLMHVSETTPILERISQQNLQVMQVWEILAMYKTLFLSSLVFLFATLFFIAYQQKPIFINKKRYLRLFSIFILIYFLPLLPAFALYFGGWHALSAFQTIQDYLANEENKQHNSIKYALNIWSKTLLFTLLAFVFLAVGTWFWLHFYQSWDPLPLLFVFLSLITLPHLNVMHRMNKVNV